MENINIAILDPLLRSRKNFVEALSQYDGVTVFEAITSKELSSIMLKSEINLVVMELELARENPYYIMQNIRNNSKRKYTPIIVITSVAERKSYIRAFTYGAVDFIMKPIEKESIAARILGYVKEEKASIDSDGSVEMDLQEYMEFAFKMSSRAKYPLYLIMTTFFVDTDKHSKFLDEEYFKISSLIKDRIKSIIPKNGCCFPYGSQCIISFVPFYKDEEIEYLKNSIQCLDISDIRLSDRLKGLKFSAEVLKYDFENKNYQEAIKDIPDIMSEGIKSKKGRKV